jgi:hypothetical protein
MHTAAFFSYMRVQATRNLLRMGAEKMCVGYKKMYTEASYIKMQPPWRCRAQLSRLLKG